MRGLFWDVRSAADRLEALRTGDCRPAAACGATAKPASVTGAARGGGGWGGDEPFRLSADAVLLLLADAKPRVPSLDTVVWPDLCELASTDAWCRELRAWEVPRSPGATCGSWALRPEPRAGAVGAARSASASAAPMEEARLRVPLLRRSLEALLGAAPSGSAALGAGSAYAHSALVCTSEAIRYRADKKHVTCNISMLV